MIPQDKGDDSIKIPTIRYSVNSVSSKSGVLSALAFDECCESRTIQKISEKDRRETEKRDKQVTAFYKQWAAICFLYITLHYESYNRIVLYLPLQKAAAGLMRPPFFNVCWIMRCRSPPPGLKFKNSNPEERKIEKL